MSAQPVAAVPLLTDTTLTELWLLLLAFVLCALIGLERQVRLKSAGFRTHVLVGVGSCGFTLVSAFGFSEVLGHDVMLDPSRISAQIVSGIGFLGAGVIFTRRDAVRGLTTAATIWVAAAVGMAAGAGLVSLAIMITIVQLVTMVLLTPLVRRIPTIDRNKVLRIRYDEANGVLRTVLTRATSLGYSASILSTTRDRQGDAAVITVDVHFVGRTRVDNLVESITEMDGVRHVELRRRRDLDDGDD